MSAQKKVFGEMPDGREVVAYTIKNKSGAEAEILTYGGTLNSLMIAGRNGVFKDVLLGFDDMKGQIERSDYEGQLVGRYANRISNGRFKIGDETYNVTKNEKGITCLHGGAEMSKEIWTVEAEDTNFLQLGFESPDGAHGFPGKMTVSVKYTLSDDNELSIEYCAFADKDTIINLTNHSYFNLKGVGQGNILDHVMQINAESFTPTDENSIPTGEIRPVKGTPFDFTQPKEIGKEIAADYDQLNYCRGYDHNFCLQDGEKAKVTVYEPNDGLGMEVYTDLPGVQLYCGNFLDNKVGKKGAVMNKHSGFCLETQYYPDTPNQPDFPQCTFKAGEKFISKTSYKFFIKR